MRHWIILLLLLCASPPGHAQAVLLANPGPSNNAGPVGSAIFFDVEATTGIVVTGLTTAATIAPGSNYSVRVSTRAGTALAGPVGAGPGSSSVGWTLQGTVPASQGSGEISLPITLPELPIAAGQVLGVAVEFLGAGPAYFGTGAAPLETYANANLTIRTGDNRSVPFTTTGNFFSSRALVGSLIYRLADPVLPANPGPSDNNAPANAGMFFNLQSPIGAVVTGMTIASQAPPGSNFQIEVYTRSGSALGNATGSGPATSIAGWTLQGIVDARQGSGQISLPIRLPALNVAPGQTLGVGLRFLGVGPRYFGTGAQPTEIYSSPGLTLVTGQALTAPFTTGGDVFGSRALVGSLSWRPQGAQLAAAPGPTDNAGILGWGMFMDLQAQSDVVVTALNMATQSALNGNFQIQVYTRTGTTLGGTASTGPTSSSAGWTLHASVSGRQGATGELSLPVSIPDLPIGAGQTLGIALVFPDTNPRYVGTVASTVTTYSDSNLQLTTGEVKSTPFMVGGNFFVSRQLLGNVYYRSEAVFKNGFE